MGSGVVKVGRNFVVVQSRKDPNVPLKDLMKTTKKRKSE
jgi:hypothetical protein